MTVIDRTQFQRQAAIVDLLRSLPDVIAWHAVSELSIESQDDLYEFLHEIEDERSERCAACRDRLGEDDVELCGACADRSEQLNNINQMIYRSGVVIGDSL